MKKLLAILLLFASPALADSRTWTDAKGKHHSTAELADFQGGIAYLRKDDGEIITVPIAKLSKADQEFIKSSVPAVKVIEGKVIGLSDGDTLTVLDDKTPVKIRLEGIDAPESHQAYGHKSREALAGKVFQKIVRIEWRELDKYHRTLGHVFIDDRWINKEMVQDGWAWHYLQYSKSEVLADAESDARTAKAGLWADPSPTPPWDFRHPPVANEGEALTSALADSPPVRSKVTESPKASAPDTVDRNPNSEQSTGQTATGIPTYTGPRGGQYHYSKSGKKVYEKKKK